METLSKLPLTKIISLKTTQKHLNNPEVLSTAISGVLAGQKDAHFVGASSTVSKNIFPRIAALRDVAMISDVIGIDGADTFVRPIYAGIVIFTRAPKSFQ